MQLRYGGVIVDETPKHLASNPTEDHHCLTVDDLKIPLELHGVTSCFPTRKPLIQEMEDCPLRSHDLTPEDPVWQPTSQDFQEREARMTDDMGNTVLRPARHLRQLFGFGVRPLTDGQLNDPFAKLVTVSAT